MTITPLLDERSKGDHFPVVVYVYHQGKKRFINTGYRVEKKYWKGAEVVRHPDSAIINSRISTITGKAKQYYAECMLKSRKVDLALIDKQRHSYSFNDYLIHRSKQYDEKEQIVTASRVRRLEAELRMFLNPSVTIEDIRKAEKKKLPAPGAPMYFEDINPDLLRDLEAWYSRNGVESNTRHHKFNKFSQFFDGAVDDGKAEPPNPFNKHKIITRPVNKIKLTVAEIKAIEDLNLQSGIINDARNLFLFSYYCKGQRFETCITLKKKEVGRDRIQFKTNKGEKYLSVKIHPRLQALLTFYKKLPGPFVLPYIEQIPETKREYISLINSWNAYVNRQLKIVAAMAGIKANLSMHIARHSFAFHLKENSNNIHVIQQALGHSRQDTTETYLKALGDEILDKEMEKVYGK